MFGNRLDEADLLRQGYRLVGDIAVRSTLTPSTDAPEATLLAQILQLARRTDWLGYHTYRSTKSPAGFPDLILVKPGRLLFAELKSRTGKLTHDQETWLALLAHSVPGVEVYCWRPQDWDQIHAILTGGAP